MDLKSWVIQYPIILRPLLVQSHIHQTLLTANFYHPYSIVQQRLQHPNAYMIRSPKPIDFLILKFTYYLI